MVKVENTYCLDTNVLIQAWQKYYSPKYCQDYWDVLNTLGNNSKIFIPEEVYDEILYEIKKERITDISKINHIKIRAILKKLKITKYYEHVHHIVSNVRGRLRPEVTPVDVIRAVFPGGTITGCPKVRCMEIIAEMEKHGRSFYTGSFG
ncbi:MAG: DUF4411 family protein, partial [Candidatus Marinimicrobia bacterium]|nr:DUF4411 family protein [Candidatus Neomarinimicrobiota bacterium]